MVDGIWDIHRWKDILEIGGTGAALLFTGLALTIDARVRRAQTVIEITKQHREIWGSFYDTPRLSRLFDSTRDLAIHPLTDEEVHFVNFLLQHLRATFVARDAGIYVQPEHLAEDIQGFFSYPATKAVWDAKKDKHDRKFVEFVERAFREGK